MPASEFAQRRRVARRQGVELRRRRIGPGRRRQRRRLFQHHVCVGAREAERTHACEPPPADRFPRLQSGWHAQRQLTPGDVRARVAEVQVGRNGALLQREHELDQPAHAGSGFEVAEVGLHRAEPERPCRVSARAEHVAERLHFERVAELRAGAMGFDDADVARRDACPCQGLADHRLLGRAVRCGQAAARPVLVDGAAADQREDAVAVGLRV